MHFKNQCVQVRATETDGLVACSSSGGIEPAGPRLPWRKRDPVPCPRCDPAEHFLHQMAHPVQRHMDRDLPRRENQDQPFLAVQGKAPPRHFIRCVYVCCVQYISNGRAGLDPLQVMDLILIKNIFAQTVKCIIMLF